MKIYTVRQSRDGMKVFGCEARKTKTMYMRERQPELSDSESAWKWRERIPHEEAWESPREAIEAHIEKNYRFLEAARTKMDAYAETVKQLENMLENL